MVIVMSPESEIEIKDMEEKVRKVVREVLKEVDFDLEDLLDSGRDELEDLIMEVVLSLFEDDDIPFIELSRAVEEDDVEALKDDDGNFMLN
jgi:hypothetical protein